MVTLSQSRLTRPLMNPDRWQKVEQLFEAACERSRGDRDRFLDDACGTDLSLRREIEALLAADDDGSKFIEPPTRAVDGGEEREHREQLPAGTRLGAYEIVKPIASGGMGRVYLARRSDQHYEKLVAVKVIKRGIDTDEVLRRFQSERQTLAQLEHPHIARLLDGGMTADGLPYLVMEYIEGLPIDAYCDRNRLSIAQRLELFRNVCSAVQYAHRNLVIHRDIKPANILVGGDGTPRLVDFGIAKVLDPAAGAGSSLITVQGIRPLTPEYASPEQLRGEPVSTSSDVYSLGVVLYELLTGHRPYRFDTGLPSEMLRVITEREPEKPSTVVTRPISAPGRSESDEAASTPEALSRTRGGHPRRLRRTLAGDLDNIVLMALRKEPDRRYAGVEQLSEDIERHLKGMPVIARRDAWGYRATKFVKRHFALTAMAAALALTLVGGILGIAWAAREAVIERDMAREERIRADAAAEQFRVEAQKVRQINDFVRNMLSAVEPEREGIDVTVREVLDAAAEHVEADLDAQPEVEAEVRITLGKAYTSIGHYDLAAPHLRRALDLRRNDPGTGAGELGESLNELGHLLQCAGEDEESMALLEEARTVLLDLGSSGDPARSSVMCNMGIVLQRRGAFEDAEALFREALDIRRQLSGENDVQVADTLSLLATLKQEMGQYPEADALHQEAVDIKRLHLGEDHPSLATDYNNWGSLLRVMGRPQESEELLRQAVGIRREKLGERHPLLAVSLANLALLLKETGRIDEAEALYREALDIQREVLGPKHPELAASLNDLAAVLRVRGDYEGAEAVYRESLEIVEALYGREHRHAAIILHNLGRLYHAQSKLDEAESFYREALEIRRRVLGPDHPDVAVTLNNLGALLTNRGDYAAARPIYEEALDLRRRGLPAGHPKLGGSLYQLAMIVHRLGDADGAEPLIRECLDIWTADPTEGPFAVAMARGLMGQVLHAQGRYDESEPLLLASHESLLEAVGPSSEYTQRSIQSLVALYDDLGDSVQAERYREMLGAADAIAAEQSADSPPEGGK